MSNRPVSYESVETHEHPEGGDRGGYAKETHTFLVYPDGRVEHDYSPGCDPHEPADFGLDNETLRRLTTKEDAVEFVDAELVALRDKLAEKEELRAKLLAATEYKAVADYFGYDDDDDEEEEEEGDEEE